MEETKPKRGRPKKNIPDDPKADVRDVAKVLATPSGYAKIRLGIKLHPKQAQVLDALFEGDRSKILFKCANEVGKTRIVCVVAILYAIEIAECICISTSATYRQVTKQLIPALREHAGKFQGGNDVWEFLDNCIKVNGETRYLGFSSDSDATTQGFHASEKRKLLAIVDEAAGVRDEIFHGISRYNATYLLICGSPLGPEGFFYNACNNVEVMKPFKHYSMNKFECLKQDGWWIDKKDIEDFIQMWGEAHPIVLSSVYAQFTTTVENGLISLAEVDKCYNYPPPHHKGKLHVGCDFAAGGDSNVVALRNGNKVEIIAEWKETDTMRACERFLGIFNDLKEKYNIQPSQVSGDADGMGIAFIHRLKDLGWRINEFHGGASAENSDQYANKISELWFEGIKAIRNCALIMPDNNDFKLQILSRKQLFNDKGKLKLESKQDMKSRGIHSPDIADAAFIALSDPSSGNLTQVHRLNLRPKNYSYF